MIEVTVSIGRPARYRLSSAILVYSNGDMPRADCYATLHTVTHPKKGGPRLEPGVTATAEGCAEFVRAIVDRGGFDGFIEPRMLYIGPRVAVWWRAPAPARVWFECPPQKKPVNDIGTRNAVVPHPGLVFAIADGEWYVAAVKGRDRPQPDTPLFVAPYFNVWTGGHICEGNVERPARVTPETISHFERAFFESKFTHPNQPRITTSKGGPYAFWKAMLEYNGDADKRVSAFPEHALRSAKTTLAGYIKQLEDRTHHE
jgi:PRTRC genetic system protein B